MSELWTAALEAASDARLLANHGSYRGACTRAYFAMFSAARVLLFEDQSPEVRKLKKHASVVRLFSLRFIRNGPFDARFGEILREAAELRVLVDYEGGPISADDALAILQSMDEFFAVAESVRSREAKL